MKDIVLIESIGYTKEGIEVKAIVEDMVYVRGSQTLYDPPEYAPALCSITIPFSDLPEHLDYSKMNEDQLQEILNRHANLDDYEWFIETESSGYDRDDDDSLSKVYF